MSNEFGIEVVYALPQQQVVLPMRVMPGTTVQQAIETSGLLAKFSEIDLSSNKVGIYGKLTKLDAVVRERDRIEIYRPLIADPKEVRRKRAEEGKVMKKGGGDVVNSGDSA
jgi:hypothetical protein